MRKFVLFLFVCCVYLSFFFALFQLNSRLFSLESRMSLLQNEVREPATAVELCTLATFMVHSPEGSGPFGSAVLIDKGRGLLLTAAHVVVDNPKVVSFAGTKIPILSSVASESVDLGIISIDPQLIANLSCVSLQLSEYNIPLGTPCFACGYPGLLEGGMSLTSGRILSKQVRFHQPMYQMAVRIHEGMSGGPIVDVYGNVIAISCYIVGTPGFLGTFTPEGYSGGVPVKDNLNNIHLLLQEIGDGK